MVKRKELTGRRGKTIGKRVVDWKKQWKVKGTKSLGKCREKEDKQERKVV